MLRTVLLSATCWLLVVGRSACGSDTVTLRGGQSLRGVIVDHRSDEKVIKLRTESGEIPVLRSTIERIDRDPDAEARYWLAREYSDETAAGLYELALWCQANEMIDQRDELLHEVLGLDANHAGARKMLGYARRGREWVLADSTSAASDSKAAQPVAEDFERDKGRREKLELLKRRQAILEKQQEVRKTVTRLLKWLESKNPDQVREARAELPELRDPLAIGPLTKAMATASEPNRIRLLEAVNAIPALEAGYAVAIASVVDVSPDVRARAVDLLKERGEQARMYVPLLEQSLRSEKQGLIYNGAEALTELGRKSSIPRLIDSLHTTVRTNYLRTEKGLEYPGWLDGVKLVDVWAGPERDIPLNCPP